MNLLYGLMIDFFSLQTLYIVGSSVAVCLIGLYVLVWMAERFGPDD